MPERRRGRIASSPLLTASVVAHAAGAATIVLSPRSAAMVLAALVANHAVIGTAGLFPRSGWLGPNMTRLPAGRARANVLALTFDDGPDPALTPRVLDLLDQAGQKATFFCIGERAEAHPDLIAAMRARGHGIENHSHSHPNSFALGGPRRMAREVARAQEAIERCGGGRPSYFRAPAGIQNPFLHGVLANAHLSLVSWTRRGFDTVSRSGARVASRLIGAGLSAGDILLLHDRSPVALEALPIVLDDMQRRGLRSEALHVAVAGRDGASD
jgi:peptidoglycan/xylan/chitin deacetylase (PgdA/CDA1 family)